METITKIESLPSTTNGWGFSGSVNKVRYTISNGDVWISGTACYRHLPSEDYIQARFKSGNPEYTEGFTGSMHNDYDVLRKGKAETHILNYYKKKNKNKNQ